jgi:hypothetical protein
MVEIDGEFFQPLIKLRFTFLLPFFHMLIFISSSSKFGFGLFTTWELLCDEMTIKNKTRNMNVQYPRNIDNHMFNLVMIDLT